jgi:hypothetical protein
MQELIQQLRASGLGFNQPLSEEGIERLEHNLECRLPEDVVALYRDHDGHQRCGALIWRLLPSSEVVRLHKELFQDWGRIGLRFFWYDEQSNYAGLYVDGPLQGRVCIEQHDDHDLSPRFRSPRSFLAVVARAATEEREIEEQDFDYTRQGPVDQGDERADWLAAQALRRLYESSTRDEGRQDYAFAIMALTPLAYTDTLIAFLDDEDLWIPERAAEVLGARKFEPAIEKLFEVARRGKANGALAARQALESIGTKRSREMLKRLRK